MHWGESNKSAFCELRITADLAVCTLTVTLIISNSTSSFRFLTPIWAPTTQKCTNLQNKNPDAYDQKRPGNSMWNCMGSDLNGFFGRNVNVTTTSGVTKRRGTWGAWNLHPFVNYLNKTFIKLIVYFRTQT